MVGLHTWSADRFNQQDSYLPFCQERGWALLLPEFRGPDLTSNPRADEACGSLSAKQDIIDAVEHACAGNSIDASNVFLVGGSGGGHMALMVAAPGYLAQCESAAGNIAVPGKIDALAEPLTALYHDIISAGAASYAEVAVPGANYDAPITILGCEC